MPETAEPGRVVAYVSGHGFGHAAREITILRNLPAEIPLTVKSSSAEWFWRAEMGRPFDFIAESFDVGCVQHDSIEIDIPATYAAWTDVAARNRERLAGEIGYLKAVDARVVIADVSPFALTVANAAGIPSICVANFTWADIYERFIEQEPRFAGVVDDLKREYAKATICLETDLALEMPYFSQLEKVGLVARPGVSNRDRLAVLLPASARDKRLALVYIGNWGYPLPYEKLETLTDWHFLSLNASPVPVANWTQIEMTADWKHPDLTASVDLVISKPGYGIAAECLSTGTPFLYPPRPQFREYDAIDAALTVWPGGMKISNEEFLALDWRAHLDRVPSRSHIPKLPANGGPTAERRIAESYYRNA